MAALLYVAQGSPLCAADDPAATRPVYRLATFSCDVTIPLGHACMGGGIEPAREIVDPLLAKGLVLLGPEKPIVIVAVDWCELRNDAYDRWREVLAEAAGTSRERVMLTSVHQHDAPVCDLTAQKFLDEVGLKNSLCDPEFHEKCVQRVAASLRDSLKGTRSVAHFGIGQAKVHDVGSNRRVVDPDGKVNFHRGSATKDPAIRAAPVGEIDPFVKTLSFWDGDKPLAAINIYSTHPMSYYGRGGVSWDFVGMAREHRQKDDPSVFQIYMTGCSGDTTAGKYNDGAKENRPVLADRMYRAMVEAWEATTRHPLAKAAFTITPLRLTPRDTVENLRKCLNDASERTFYRNLAAMGLSWHQRVTTGQPIDIPVLDLGRAQFMLLPAESFVGYQLMAQQMHPDSFVMVAGFAECAPGYIPTRQASEDGFEDHWCWVASGSDKPMAGAIKAALAR